ncbi:MAG TPA: GNAT family N-acetyltransferase [Actinomycetota bacterium]|nr:GNAT family N-acetyltransferase [Actinomycetota bacterium]
MDDLARFFGLERRLLERLSTRIEHLDLGTAFFDDGYRERFNSNFLLVEGPLDHVPAETLLGVTDRVLDEAGFRHRSVVVRDDRAGERYAPLFVRHGYRVERSAIMVHRRGADRPSDLPAEEVPFADVKDLIREVYRREPWAHSDEIVRLFTEQHGKNERVIGARFFIVRLDGQLAGDCELYVDGSDAQVEYVDTLEEFRGRGVARAVVLRAVEAAREAGTAHVFIVADDDDWPKGLYERLGFDRIGRTWQFVREPS